MRILRVIASMNPSTGGPCQGIRNSVPELVKLGIYNEVVCLDDPGADFLGKDTFPIHALGSNIRIWRYSGRLISWLLENFGRFDVVVVHGLWLYHSYAVNKALTQFRQQQKSKKNISTNVPKLFLMPHGMLDPYFQKASDRKMKAIRNWAYWKLIEGHVVNKADGVLFTCATELQLAREPFRPYQPKKEINIGYGIDAPPPCTVQMRKAFHAICPQVAGSRYLLFLSRIHPKKGVDLVLNAYASFLKKHIKTGKQLPQLVIAGPGQESSYGQQMQLLVSEDPLLSSNVFFPGMLTGDAKWGAFYGCEVYILPSHQENFGIAVVEALACSKPVLVSNQVNIWREIEAFEGGLVAGNTLEETIALLESWESLSPLAKEEMGSCARSCFENNFAIGPAARKLLKAVSA